MKKLILIYLSILLLPVLAFGQATSGERQVIIHTESSSGTVKRGCRHVTFIFNASFAGTVGNATFAATNSPLVIPAQTGDVLKDIPYTVTAGSVTIVEVR